MVGARFSLHVAPRAVIASASERLLLPLAGKLDAAADTAMRAAIRPDCRLHSPREFAAVFAHRRAVRGKLFNLHYRPNELSGARLGFVVAKKLARRAVLRNLIKRIAREAFRLKHASLPHHDLVLRLAAAPRDASRAAMRLELDSLLDRLPRP